MSASPQTSDVMCLISAASRLIALSNASGPSSTPPVICPRSAILHIAAASIVEGILEFTVSTAERIATFGSSISERLRQLDGVLDDIDFVLERREDVDRRVGDEERLGVGRHVHDEDMADAAFRAQTGVLADDRGHQFVGVETALHQQLRFTEAHQLDRLLSGGVAVRDIDDLISAEIELQLLGDGPDLRYWADQKWQNDPRFRRFYCARQRRFVARVGHCCRERCPSPAAGNQPQFPVPSW